MNHLYGLKTKNWSHEESQWVFIALENARVNADGTDWWSLWLAFINHFMMLNAMKLTITVAMTYGTFLSSIRCLIAIQSGLRFPLELFHFSSSFYCIPNMINFDINGLNCECNFPLSVTWRGARLVNKFGKQTPTGVCVCCLCCVLVRVKYNCA